MVQSNYRRFCMSVGILQSFLAWILLITHAAAFARRRRLFDNVELKAEFSPCSSKCEGGLHHFLTRAWETFPPVASDLKCLLL